MHTPVATLATHVPVHAQGARAQLSEGRVEHVRTGAVAETAAAGLRQQLVAKEEELRRVRAESSSAQKQLEKAIERLQREVDASAAEIARLKVRMRGRVCGRVGRV